MAISLPISTLFLLFIAVVPHALAQKNADLFTQIATDVSGDSHSGLSDAKGLSVAFNPGGDTIYIRLETYTPRPDEFGIAFGLDTDHDPNNGKPWLGSTNLSAKWDYRVVVSRNVIFEPEPSMQIYSSSDLPVQAGSFNVVSPTVMEIVLSLAALNADPQIGIVAGTGAFDILGSSAADDIPNSGYARPSASSVDREHLAATAPLTPRPNVVGPSGQFTVPLSAGDISPAQSIQIRDHLGRMLPDGAFTVERSADACVVRLGDLASGLYFLRLEPGGKGVGRILVR